MRYVASLLLMLGSGLWVGMLAGLFLFAPAIFEAFAPDRALAGRATSAMFVKFAQVQLFLAAAGLVGAFLGYVDRKRGVFVALFVLFAAACVGAVLYKMFLIPRMEEMRAAGMTSDPKWGRLHGWSMMVSTGIGVLMLGAVVVTGFAQRELLRRREIDETRIGATEAQ